MFPEELPKILQSPHLLFSWLASIQRTARSSGLTLYCQLIWKLKQKGSEAQGSMCSTRNRGRGRETARQVPKCSSSWRVNVTHLQADNWDPQTMWVSISLSWPLGAHSREPDSMKDSSRTGSCLGTADRGKRSKIKQTKVDTERKKINVTVNNL